MALIEYEKLEEPKCPICGNKKGHLWYDEKWYAYNDSITYYYIKCGNCNCKFCAIDQNDTIKIITGV
jgi:C4-type Zn-finger protein